MYVCFEDGSSVCSCDDELSRGEKGAYISLFDGKKYKGRAWRDVILSMIAAFSRLKAGANGRREWTWEGRVIVRSLVQGV